MDETYIKVKGQWMYLYRAVDKEGNTIDFMLSDKRNKSAARAFFTKAIGSSGLPDRVTMDKRASTAIPASWPIFNRHEQFLARFYLSLEAMSKPIKLDRIHTMNPCQDEARIV